MEYSSLLICAFTACCMASLSIIMRVPKKEKGRVSRVKSRAPERMHFRASTIDLRHSTELGPTGVEPARPCGHKALNLARLPIPPRARFTKFTRQKHGLQGSEIVAF